MVATMNKIIREVPRNKSFMEGGAIG
jgi:hypothetical protein